MDTNPYEFPKEFDPKARRYSFRVRIKRDPPELIGVLTGECLQALRSALDHLAWSLALQVVSSPPQTTAFPIFASEKLYRRDKNRFIGAIDSSAHPIFDAVQPFNRTPDDPARDPLYVLHRLAADDRHKVPSIAGIMPRHIGISIEPKIPGNDNGLPPGMGMGLNVGPFEDGQEVGFFVLPPNAPPDTKVHINFTMSPAFGKDMPRWGAGMLLPEIDRVGREVESAILRFEDFF